jgi:hypothetical protein
LNHIPVSWNCDIYQHTCSLFTVACYNVWLVIGDGPVSLYFLVPQYGYLTSSACFYWFWYMFIPVFLCLTVPLFSCICWSVAVHSLYHVFLYTVLLPVLGMQIWCGLLSHQIGGKACICYLSLCSIFLFNIALLLLLLLLSKDSSIGIATAYRLDGPGIESRWGTRFSAPVQTGPRAHPASYTMGTGPFLGVKWPWFGVEHPSLLTSRLKKV